MADLSLDWGDDLTIAANGDLMLADGDTLVQERILRRLLTAVRAYVWHQDYGAGLPQRIGKVARARDIQSLIRAQIALEATVAKTPVPVITIAADETVFGLYNVLIQYTDAATGQAVNLDFEVPTTS